MNWGLGRFTDLLERQRKISLEERALSLISQQSLSTELNWSVSGQSSWGEWHRGKEHELEVHIWVQVRSIYLLSSIFLNVCKIKWDNAQKALTTAPVQPCGLPLLANWYHHYFSIVLISQATLLSSLRVEPEVICLCETAGSLTPSD